MVHSYPTAGPTHDAAGSAPCTAASRWPRPGTARLPEAWSAARSGGAAIPPRVTSGAGADAAPSAVLRSPRQAWL